MTQAIGARRDGDAFQARTFWLKAAKLLDADGAIVRVGFESGPKGFDDLWVEYEPARSPQDQYGQPLLRERFQCKWHVGPGHFTHIDMTRPEYINASTKSLLQRAHSAFDEDRAAGIRSRMKLLTNHRIDPSDALHALVRNRSHTLNVENLFAGKTEQSATGQVRKLWRDHLQIDDDELRALCMTLGISQTYESLDDLRDRLDEACHAYGLQRIVPNSSAVIYDDVVRQWATQGRLVFDRKSFRDACEQEGLLTAATSPAVVFGVKSFEHAFDLLEDRCVKVLDLIPQFDDRFIRDSTAWRSKLLPDLRQFLTEAARATGGQRLRLAIDAHTSLAFAAGTILNTKSGRVVEIEQRSPARVVWSPDDLSPSPVWPDWDITVQVLTTDRPDMALGVALTQDVEPKVKEFVTARLPTVGRLIVARPTSGHSQQSVVCGAHAYQLAENLAKKLKALRESLDGRGEARLHLFMAAPNGFNFYLGRHVESLKPLTLYEFDFQSQRDRSYEPSFSVPEVNPGGGNSDSAT